MFERFDQSVLLNLSTIMTVPTASLSPLNRADGSANYSSNGYTIVGAVNGPIEVQRRDEMPEEATIEVNVRPAVGVGSMLSTINLTLNGNY